MNWPVGLAAGAAVGVAAVAGVNAISSGSPVPRCGTNAVRMAANRPCEPVVGTRTLADGSKVKVCLLAPRIVRRCPPG